MSVFARYSVRISVGTLAILTGLPSLNSVLPSECSDTTLLHLTFINQYTCRQCAVPHSGYVNSRRSGLIRVPLRVMSAIRENCACFGGLNDLLAASNVAAPAV